MKIAFFGSSLVSAYWNGACTYYRGIVRALAERGHEVTFYEPDILDRQAHRDIPDPEWATVVVYAAESEDDVAATVERAAGADLIVKASGVGAFDDVLERATLDVAGNVSLCAFWDVDAPATLARMEGDADDALRKLVPSYDLVLTYGGGDPVVRRYEALGARACVPIYNALDPSTHFPAAPDPRFRADLSFLGNRLPDREARVEEFFFRAVEMTPGRSFLLGGAGWDDRVGAPNLTYRGHVSPQDHNTFNCSATAVLNVSRESMAANGFSPATRVFEAAGAGACLITDFWEGIETFLEPGAEVLVARDGAEVAAALESLTPERARSIGDAARDRILAEHTYAHRAAELEALLDATARAGAR
ncbi:MAG TPA: glycosyltransferase [Actinomycetota bacterium]|nr:glycosyltransferase [Actinomycetota bacterium]